MTKKEPIAPLSDDEKNIGGGSTYSMRKSDNVVSVTPAPNNQEPINNTGRGPIFKMVFGK
jgi:hypothetical protein